MTLPAAEAAQMRAVALTDSITVVNRTMSGTDRYGNPIWVDGAPTVVPAHIERMDATEDEISRDTRVSRYRVKVGPGTVLDGRSKITWGTRSLEVMGEPLDESEQGLRLLEFIAREITD